MFFKSKTKMNCKKIIWLNTRIKLYSALELLDSLSNLINSFENKSTKKEVSEKSSNYNYKCFYNRG